MLKARRRFTAAICIAVVSVSVSGGGHRPHSLSLCLSLAVSQQIHIRYQTYKCNTNIHIAQKRRKRKVGVPVSLDYLLLSGVPTARATAEKKACATPTRNTRGGGRRRSDQHSPFKFEGLTRSAGVAVGAGPEEW